MKVTAQNSITTSPLLSAPKEQTQEQTKFRKVAEEFESVFLEIIFKSMRASVEKSGLMDGGNAEEIYRSMLDTEYAKSMASQRQTGIADSLEKQLLASSQVISERLHAVKQNEGARAYDLQNSVKLLPGK